MKTLLKIIGQKRTWLGSYCVIILIAILTNMIGYSVTKNMMLQNIEKDSINSLKNMQNIYDNYFQEAFNSAYNVLQSPSVSKLSGDMPLSRWQKNDYLRNISTEMQNGMYGHRIMEECILIIENKDLCISSGGSMDIETAYDIYFSEYFENIADWEKELLNGYGSYVRMLNNSKNKKADMYLVYRIRGIRQNKCMIIKIYNNVINGYLSNLSAEYENYFISDFDSNVIFSSKSVRDTEKIKKPVTNSVKSGQFDLIYNRTIDENVYLSDIRKVRNAFVAGYLLCILINGMLAVWFSYLQEKNKRKIHEALAEHRETARQNVLRKVISGEIRGKDIESLLVNNEININSQYIMLLFDVLQYNNDSSYHDCWEMIRRELTAHISEGTMYFCEIDRSLVVICSTNSENIEKLSSACDHIIKKLDEEWMVNAVCSISSAFIDIKQISKAYKQVIEIVNFCFIGEEKNVFVYDDILGVNFTYDASTEKRLISCVTANDRESIAMLLREVYRINLNKGIGIGVLRMLTLQLVNTAVRAREQINSGEENYKYLYEMYSVINDIKKPEELEKKACECILAMCDFSKKNAASSNELKYKNIAKYIEENYANQNMNVNMIANVFDINRSWLSEMFKKSMGEGIADYIVKYRLKKAKELLETDYSVAEAAEKSGFSSTVVFNRAFKKFEGITPGQYRAMYNR